MRRLLAEFGITFPQCPEALRAVLAEVVGGGAVRSPIYSLCPRAGLDAGSR